MFEATSNNLLHTCLLLYFDKVEAMDDEIDLFGLLESWRCNKNNNYALKLKSYNHEYCTSFKGTVSLKSITVS